MTSFSRRHAMALAGGTIASVAHAEDQPKIAGKITERQFEKWLDIRGGLEGPAFWYSEGFVRPIADGGKVASRMLGVEMWVTPASTRTATSAISLSRKIYFFLRADRDEIVVDAAGKPLRPSIYPYQIRNFTLRDGAIGYSVESHDLRGARQSGGEVLFTYTEFGDQVHVNYGSFPVREGANGQRAAAGEIYDYFDNGPKIPDAAQRYQMAWVGTNAEGRIMNMHGWRFAAFEDIPNAWLKTTIRDKAPLWMAPPREIAEIERIRAATPYAVPGLGL